MKEITINDLIYSLIQQGKLTMFDAACFIKLKDEEEVKKNLLIWLTNEEL